ncbi:MAG: FliG C-terminal domain-containing protein [Gemmata sp.]
MPDAPGDDVAVLLLRLMPAEVGEAILGRLGTDASARLRARLGTETPNPSPNNEIDSALAHFFDLQRIAERSPPAASPAAESEPPREPTPSEAIRALTPQSLAKALEGEQPGAVALILGSLDPVAAGQVIQGLPLDVRAEVTLRMSRPGARNQALLDKLMKAVAEKGRRLREVPKEPTQDELITNLADMLRAVPRAERLPVIKKIEASDPDLAAKIAEKLYRIEDLLKIPDRQIQALLGKLDVKTLAVALKGSDAALMAKVSNNMSSRSREVLADESALLGSIPVSRIREAQNKVIAVVRKAEEDGEITPEE